MAEPALQSVSYKLSRQHVLIAVITVFIALAYVLHAVFGQTAWGWVALVVPASIITYKRLWARSQIGLVLLAITMMIVTPVGSQVSVEHCTIMTIGMVLAVVAPYLLARRYFKHSLVHFNLLLRRPWSREEISYVVFASVACTLAMYAYFNGTDAHHNWPLSTTADIIVVFVSIMVIGIWEEFFFIATIYGILQRLLPFAWAILLQAVLFTAFLYQIGFQGWIVPLVFMYAIFQAYVFHKTKTLLITLIIHILVDLSVFVNLLIAAKL